MKILVRNLSRDTTERDIRDLFERFGTIESCTIVMDEVSGRSKGFGFVEMPEAGEARKAIAKLNKRVVHGSPIRVKTTNR